MRANEDKKQQRKDRGLYYTRNIRYCL